MVKIQYNNYKDYKTINYQELIKLRKNKDVLVIDVRSRQEFFEGHIKEAINIPLIDIKKYEFNKNQAIILYCNAGIRSVKAKRILEAKGYDNIYILEPIS